LEKKDTKRKIYNVLGRYIGGVGEARKMFLRTSAKVGVKLLKVERWSLREKDTDVFRYLGKHLEGNEEWNKLFKLTEKK